ncbi:MAG: type II toxin-antitoxin system VapC family toxin [Myxococcota bacterium]
MTHLLDTNTCIYLIKNNPLRVVFYLRQHAPCDIVISSITLAELRYGANNSKFPAKNHRVLDDFVQPFHIEPFCKEAAQQYGEIYAQLRRAGQTIGYMDALIASHALARNWVLVSNNLREFKRVPRLRCENWAEPMQQQPSVSPEQR